MNGLKIVGRNNFEDNFSCIYGLIQGLHWLTEQDSFAPPEGRACRKLSRVFPDNDNWYQSKEDIFPEYGKWVNEDWNALYAFKEHSTDLAVWAKNYWNEKSRAEYISMFCEVVFINVDAAYWAIYSGNTLLLNTVKEHIDAAENCVLAAEPGI